MIGLVALVASVPGVVYGIRHALRQIGRFEGDPSRVVLGVILLVGSALPDSWADRVECRAGTTPQLVRPDGYVVWAGGPGLDTALHRWLGSREREPEPAVQGVS